MGEGLCDRSAGPVWRHHYRKPNPRRHPGRPIKDIFTEVIIAPRFSLEALAILEKKKNLRLMVASEGLGADALQEIRSVVGGVLVQDRDRTLGNPAAFKVVTKRQPTPQEWDAMLFGWKVCKHVKSNAIVYCTPSTPG